MVYKGVNSDQDGFSGRMSLWILRAGLIALPLVIFPEVYRFAPLPKQLILQIVALCFAVCCLMARRVRLPRKSTFAIPLLFFLLVCTIQSLRSFNPSRGLLMLSLQLGCGIISLGVANLIPPREIVSLVRITALTGAGVSILGILEFLGMPFAMLPSVGRPSSTFGFRNVAGMYLSINLPLSATLLFRKNRQDWAIGAVALFTMSAFLIFTRSRGAWLGLAASLGVGIAVAFWIRGFQGDSLTKRLWSRLTPFRRKVGIVLVLSLLGLIWVQPRFSDKNLHRFDEKKIDLMEAVASLVQPGGDRGRLRIWQHTMEMISAHPIWGVGLENWKVFYPLYDKGDVLVLESAPERPHNDFLWIWAELGTVGILIYFWLLGTVGMECIKKMLKGEEEHRILTLFMSIGLLAFLGHSFFSFPRQEAAPLMIFWIILGLLARPDTQIREVGWRFRVFSAVGTIVALACIGLCMEAIRFDFHFARALAAKASGLVKKQIEEAGHALERGTFDHRIFLILGEGKSNSGDYAGAVKVYQNYKNYQPHLPAVYNNLGRAYGALGAYEEAEMSYHQGIEIFPKNVLLLNNLAGIYREKGELDRALDLYRGEGPKNAGSFHNLGLLYAEKKIFDKALDSYQKALDLDPEMVEVYYSVGGIYLLKGNIEASVGAYETFLDRWRGSQTYVDRAKAHLNKIYPILGSACVGRGELFRAELIYRRLEFLGGATADTFNNLAIICRRRGDLEAAQVAIRKAIETDVDFSKAYFTLAELLDKVGDREGALGAYRAFLDRWSVHDRFSERARDREKALDLKR